MSFMFYNCSSPIELKFNSADFSNVSLDYLYSIFNSVPNITIYVKDEAAQSFVNTAIQNSGETGQVIIQPLES